MQPGEYVLILSDHVPTLDLSIPLVYIYPAGNQRNAAPERK
jgi:hypothetical protein